MEWRKIPGQPYEVSEDGQFRRSEPGRGTWTGRPVATHPHKQGYRTVQFSYGNRMTNFLAHVIVAAVFVGPCPPGKEVNHKNGIKHDNRYTNLEYLTRPQNIQHARGTGLNDMRGEGNANAKLTATQVAAIRAEYQPGVVGYKRLADRYGVLPGTIRLIVKGQRWKTDS